MIEIQYHRYHLIPRAPLNAQTGANVSPRFGILLKLKFPDGLTGYSDLFPWPEWGDNTVEVELDRLSRGQISKLAEQSFALARKDAELRKSGENVVAKYTRVKNHLLINDINQFTKVDLIHWQGEGFGTMKVKVGRDIAAEMAWLESIATLPLKIRLDFNLRGNEGRFEKMMFGLSAGLKAKIEFVEDPFPFSFQAWRQAQTLVPIAIDQEAGLIQYEKLSADEVPFNVVILKPARQNHARIVEQMNRLQFKIAVTSSMDHPVGIIHALRVAGEIKKFYPHSVLECGCLSQNVYKTEPFAQEMVTKGPFVTQIAGTGVGFDALLEQIPWKSFAQKI